MKKLWMMLVVMVLAVPFSFAADSVSGRSSVASPSTRDNRSDLRQLRKDRIELKRDQRVLRQDRRDSRQDRRDSRQDRRDSRQDRRDLRRDVPQTDNRPASHPAATAARR